MNPFGINLAKDVMVAMRDGLRLASDIYRPAIDGEPAAAGQHVQLQPLVHG